MKALLSFKRFLQELNWPEESFAAFLDQKVAAICADRFQEAAEVYVWSCVCSCVCVLASCLCLFVCHPELSCISASSCLVKGPHPSHTPSLLNSSP